uniref:hypothetical protein n=1 Tax=Helicobacter bilis TaxID=37372 RepID=UPI001F1FE166
RVRVLGSLCGARRGVKKTDYKFLMWPKKIKIRKKIIFNKKKKKNFKLYNFKKKYNNNLG